MKKNVFLTVVFPLITLHWAAAQNVGIGTTSPTQKLDVAGNVNVSGTIMANGAAGTNGQVLTSTGSGLAWSTIGSSMGYKKCKMFNAAGSGSFTVPAGVTEVMVEAWGAGSGGSYYCGGTSGGYARTVQTIASGTTISFTVGQGSASSASSTDAGSTIVTFPGGATLSAFGGGGVTGNGIVYTKGLAKSGSGSVNNAYYMFGNMGEALRKVFSMTSPTDFQETEYSGDGGAPVGLLNTNPITGVVVFSINNGPASYMIIPNTVKIPGAGGPSYFGGINLSGGDGMVIVWYN